MSENPVVGYLGMGEMGVPMSKNIAKAGYPLVVWNRTRAKAEAVAASMPGIEVGDTPADVARKATVLITNVLDTKALLDVVEGPNGLVETMAPGSTLIDHGTVSPNATRALAARLKAKGIGMLDAPVSGGPTGAESRTLAIMVGGDEEVYNRNLPVLEAEGNNIHLVGPSGMGQTTKFVNQILVVAAFASAFEALSFTVHVGADVNLTAQAINQNIGGAATLRRTGPRIMANEFTTDAAVRLWVKDLAMVLEEARSADIPLPMTGAIYEAFKMLDQAGAGKTFGFPDVDGVWSWVAERMRDMMR
ncbi:MAG: NAD(P)-dependent oxidoreductase [SAR202 cluster bacterium]|nr:NAD(P)-dependent oxidoreductase [SAR202 cluster bacterium]